mmetsp:Transcript_54417/g.145212  ORF Transcript_54417/g.145212 Transcript_54417/m.145212 type:complete len:207 (-) Transcript_54417:171-791(-)
MSPSKLFTLPSTDNTQLGEIGCADRQEPRTTRARLGIGCKSLMCVPTSRQSKFITGASFAVDSAASKGARREVRPRTEYTAKADIFLAIHTASQPAPSTTRATVAASGSAAARRSSVVTRRFRGMFQNDSKSTEGLQPRHRRTKRCKFSWAASWAWTSPSHWQAARYASAARRGSATSDCRPLGFASDVPSRDLESKSPRSSQDLH